MRTIDLSPLYRNSIGYDRLASLLEGAFRTEQSAPNYPPYDIEALDENRYTITLAVAGFTDSEIDIHVDRGVLTVRGEKEASAKERNFLHRGIASRTFERKFNLAEHVEVNNAKLDHGLLIIDLKREIPDAMKPRRIKISQTSLSEKGPYTNQAA